MDTFDVMYPNALYLQEVEDGIIRGDPGRCFNCARETAFVETNFEAHFCSQACVADKWQEFCLVLKQTEPE